MKKRVGGARPSHTAMRRLSRSDKIMREVNRQMIMCEGQYYERWKAGMAAYVERLKVDDASASRP